MAETEAAKRSLLDIEARQADIRRLEKSIEEIRDLFQNIALLVCKQVRYRNNKASYEIIGIYYC